MDMVLRSIEKRILSYLRRPVLAASELTAAALNEFFPGNVAYEPFYEWRFHLLGDIPRLTWRRDGPG